MSSLLERLAKILPNWREIPEGKKPKKIFNIPK